MQQMMPSHVIVLIHSSTHLDTSIKVIQNIENSYNSLYPCIINCHYKICIKLGTIVLVEAAVDSNIKRCHNSSQFIKNYNWEDNESNQTAKFHQLLMKTTEDHKH